MTETTRECTVTRTDGGNTVLRPQRSLSDRGLAQLRDSFDDVFTAGGCISIAVDMSDVEYLSSDGLALLVGMLKRCAQQRIPLAICCLRPELAELFQVTQLDRVFLLAGSVPIWHDSIARAR